MDIKRKNIACGNVVFMVYIYIFNVRHAVNCITIFYVFFFIMFTKPNITLVNHWLKLK